MLAREQAKEAGRQSGILEAEAATERLVALAVEAIAGHLQSLAAIQQAANEERVREAVAVAVAVVRKLQPEMSRDHALDEIAGVIRECLTHIEKDVRVTIRVSPSHMDSIRHYANQASEATGFEGKLIYAADPRLAPGDCRVEWGDGGAERDQARLWTEIDAVIARALGDAPPQDAPEDKAETADDADAIGVERRRLRRTPAASVHWGNWGAIERNDGPVLTGLGVRMPKGPYADNRVIASGAKQSSDRRRGLDCFACRLANDGNADEAIMNGWAVSEATGRV